MTEGRFLGWLRARLTAARPKPTLQLATPCPHVVHGTDGTLAFRWNAIPGAHHYRVWLYAGDVVLSAQTVTEPACSFSDLTMGEWYRFGVQACAPDDS